MSSSSSSNRRRSSASSISPTPNDVLFGRSQSCLDNGGNVLLQQMVEKLLQEYERVDIKSDFMDKGTKRDKMVIKKEILALIRARRGRFLKKNRRGEWEEVSERKAIEKVRSTFNTTLKRVRNNGRFRPFSWTSATGSPSTRDMSMSAAGVGEAAGNEPVPCVLAELGSSSTSVPKDDGSTKPPITSRVCRSCRYQNVDASRNVCPACGDCYQQQQSCGQNSDAAAQRGVAPAAPPLGQDRGNAKTTNHETSNDLLNGELQLLQPDTIEDGSDKQREQTASPQSVQSPLSGILSERDEASASMALCCSEVESVSSSRQGEDMSVLLATARQLGNGSETSHVSRLSLIARTHAARTSPDDLDQASISSVKDDLSSILSLTNSMSNNYKVGNDTEKAAPPSIRRRSTWSASTIDQVSFPSTFSMDDTFSISDSISPAEVVNSALKSQTLSNCNTSWDDGQAEPPSLLGTAQKNALIDANPMVTQTAQSMDGGGSITSCTMGSSSPSGKVPSTIVGSTGSGNVSSLSSGHGREEVPPALPIKGGCGGGGGAPAVPDFSGLSVLVEEDGEASIMTNHTTTNNAFLTFSEIQRTLEIMQDHPEDREIQARCCENISQSLWDHGLTMCSYDGATWGQMLGPILGTLRRHMACSKVPRLALKVVDILYVSIQGNRQRELRQMARYALKSVVDIAVDAMRGSADDPVIQANGSLALSVVASSEGRMLPEASRLGIPLVVLGMQRHRSQGMVIENGCLALSRLIRKGESMRTFVSQDGIQLILEAMEEYSSSSDIQESCCKILATLATENPRHLSTTVLGPSVITRVIEAMHNHHQLAADSHLKSDGCSMLLKLASNGEDLRRIAETGISVVRVAMQNRTYGREPICLLYAKTASHISKCCKVVADAILSDLQLPACSSEVTESIAAFLRPVPSDPTDSSRGVLVKACTVSSMVGLIRSGKVPAQACTVLCSLAQNDSSTWNLILKIITGSLEENPSDAHIQQYCMYILGNLCLIPRDNANVVSFAGCVSSVAESMRVHIQNAEIQESGCRLLSVLSIKDCEFRRQIVEAGGISSVVRAMQVHVKNSDVQDIGVRFLRSMSIEDNGFRCKIVEAGGAQTVLSAMMAHSENVRIQEDGCRVLSLLSAVDAACRRKLVEESVVQTVSLAMETHLSHGKIQEHGCSIFQNLASDCEHHSAIWDGKGVEATIAGMTRHSSNAHLRILEYGCGMLSLLADNSRQKEMFDARLVRTVSSAMRTQSSHPRLQEYGCSIFLSLATDSEHHDTILDAEGVEVTLAAIQQHSSSAHVTILEHGFGVLSLLSAVDGDCRMKIVEPTVLRTVLTIMQAHLSHAKIQEYGCCILQNLSIDCEHRGAIWDAKGVDATLAAMERHSSSAHTVILEYGCSLLCSLLATNRHRRRRAAVAPRIVNSVSAVMEKHLFHPKIQEYGCSIFQHLAMDRKHHDAILDAKGVEVTIAAIRLYSSSSTHIWILEYGFGVLSLLSAVERNCRQKIVETRLVGTLSAAMQTCLSHFKIQEYGCSILHNLALDCEHYSAIWDAKGLEATLAAIQRHSWRTHSRMMEYGYGVLSLLSAVDASCGRKIVEAKVVETVANTMRDSTNAKIQEYGCSIFHNLSIDPENQRVILDANGVDATIAAIRLYSSSTHTRRILEYGCGVLSLLSDVDRNCRRKIVEARLVQIVTSAMQNHVSHPKIQEYGGCILRNLAIDCECRSAVLDANGVEATLKAMQWHCSKPHISILEYGCHVLSLLSAVDRDCRREIVEARGTQTVSKILGTHSSHSKIQQYGCTIFLNLALNCAELTADVSAGCMTSCMTMPGRDHVSYVVVEEDENEWLKLISQTLETEIERKKTNRAYPPSTDHLTETELERAIQQAMAASLEDVNTPPVIHEDEEFEQVRALSLSSLPQEHLSEIELEQAIQQAIAASSQDVNETSATTEDDELKLVLALSLASPVPPAHLSDTELEHAIQQAKDDSMQHASAASTHHEDDASQRVPPLAPGE